MSTLVALSLVCFGFGSMAFFHAKAVALSAWDMMVANGVFYAAGEFGYLFLVSFVTLFLLICGVFLLIGWLMSVSNGLKMVILTEAKVLFDADLELPDAIS
jgi:hypothetical protein|tara:strand:+ start:200 stop:502 length:303 start_codon:yes stop_codon:yes gene_type:complete